MSWIPFCNPAITDSNIWISYMSPSALNSIIIESNTSDKRSRNDRAWCASTRTTVWTTIYSAGIIHSSTAASASGRWTLTSSGSSRTSFTTSTFCTWCITSFRIISCRTYCFSSSASISCWTTSTRRCSTT